MKKTKMLAAACAALSASLLAFGVAGCSEKVGSSDVETPNSGRLAADVENLKAGEPAPEGDFEVKVNEGGTGVYATYKGNAENVVVPASIQGLPVLRVEVKGDVKSLVIPEGVVEISCGYCPKLAAVALPSSLKSLGRSAFYNCTSLVSVNLPSSLKGIGDHAFENCASLASINLPEGLSAIGCNAFSGSGLASVALPKSLGYMGDGAFSGCDKLSEVIIPDGASVVGYAAAKYERKYECIADFYEDANGEKCFSGAKIAADAALQKRLADFKLAKVPDGELQAALKESGIGW